MIHSTAIVDSTAQLGKNVRIGPYAIVEGDVVLGDECEIMAHAMICRGSMLGARNQVGPGALIGGEPQDFGYKGQPSRVEIGSGNRIREYVTIHRASVENGATRVGDDNFLMGGVHLAHDTQIGNGAIFANNTLLAGHVQVGDRAFLGGATIVHQHVRIGTLAITRGGTRLGKDVPPYLMAVATNQVAGLNRLGLRRAGFSPEARRLLQGAYEILYRSNLNITQAVIELRAQFKQPEIMTFTDFIAASQRGICRERSGAPDEQE